MRIFKQAAWLILLLQFGIGRLYSQDRLNENEDKEIINQTHNLISLNFLAPGFSIEHSVAQNATVDLNFGVYPAFGYLPNEDKWVYAFIPTMYLAYKYYVKYKHTDRKGKILISNSGNFLSPQLQISLPVGWDNFPGEQSPYAVGGLTYGWQRITFKRLYSSFDLGIGAILAGDDPGNIEPMGSVKIGYLLKYE